MKIFKVTGAVITLIAVLAALIGCSSPESETTAGNQVTTVQVGDLTLDITAAGNLALSTIENLTFDLFYSKGTVEEVMVEEGDSVEEGQVLARLNTSEWDEQIVILEDALSAAQRQATTKERALVTAKRQVETIERQVTDKEDDVTKATSQVSAKELARRQAELDIETAQYNIDAIEEVKEQQDIIDNFNYQLQFIDMKITEALSPGANAMDFQYWTTEKTRVQQALAEAQQELHDILTDNSINVSTTVAIEVSKKQLALETAQANLESANQAIVDAQRAVDEAQIELENTREDLDYAKEDVEEAQTDLDKALQDVEDAQDVLDDARAASPEIKATFDGFITQVNVEGGDEVSTGTVVAQLADPGKFEADILVSEMDISQVAIGGEAVVSIDAVTGLSLPAEVTHISPTATIQSGVVNYKVKVELASMEAMIQERTDTRQQRMADLAAGEMPERLQQAIDEGRITQEQAEEMLTRIQEGNFSPPEGFSPPGGFSPPEGFSPSAGSSGTGSQRQQSTTGLENFQLRQGLTVTVSVIVDEATDVLLVPNSAISQEGFQSYIQVVDSEGNTEKRAVQVGLSDWQYTEITDGCTEGEQILIPQGTTTTTSTTSDDRPRGGMRFFP